MTTLDPHTRRVIRELAASQHDLKRQVARLNRAQDAGRTTIHHGALEVADDQGKVTHRLGDHGLAPVPGPVPPRPAAPALIPGQAQIVVATDGDDEHGNTAPADWAKTRVYATTQPPVAANPAHAKGTITELDGETTIGVHAGVWHVGIVWVTESGQVSELSDVVTVEVEAPVEQVDLDEVNQRIDDADDYAQQQFKKYDDAHAAHVTAIESAESDIADAHERIDATDATASAAQQKAETAQQEATAAAAAAIEANNRALTRLYNGNFDRELDGWSVDNVTISTDSHSGHYAARFETASWMWAETALPVRPGQIWELSMFTKADADRMGIDVWVEDEFGEYLETFQRFSIQPTGAWTDSGGLRFEIPEGAGFLNFTMSPWQQVDSVWLVDDIVLRDVTDVVRLEQAANENRRKAQDAIDEAAALRTILEGEDGIQDRLDEALTGEIDHNRLRVGEGAFDDLFAQAIVTGVIGAKKAAVIDLIAQDLIAGNATLINAAMQTLSVTERANFVKAFANELYADEFTARTATLARAIVAAPNLWPDPGFEQDVYGAWQRVDGGIERNGSTSLSVSYVSHEDFYIAVEQGTKYRISADVTIDGPGRADIWLRDADENKVYIGGSARGHNQTQSGRFEIIHEPIYDHAKYLYIGFGTNNTDPSIRLRFENLKIERMQDGQLVVPGTIDTRHLNVSEDMAAALAHFGKAMADEFFANRAFIDRMAASEAYFGAETANLRNITNGQGMHITAPNRDDPNGPRQTLMQMGVWGDNTWVTIDPETGETLSAIGADGAASFQMIDSATDPAIGGRKLVGGLVNHPASQYSQGILDSIGWGEPAYVSTIPPSAGPYTAGEVGLLQANFIAYPGRRYQIVAEAGHLVRNGSTIRANLRYTNNGLDPDIGSTILDHAAIGGPAGTWQQLTITGRIAGSTDLEHGAPIPVRLLLSINSSSDWSFVNGGGYRDLSIQVLDVGPIRPASGYARNVRSTTGGTTPGVTAYTSAWPASVMANYRNQGAARRTGGTASTYIMQGYDPNNTGFGSQGSLIWFNQATQGEVGATIPAAMAGADLESGSLDVFGEYIPGHLSVRARAYWHEYTTTPDTMAVYEPRLIGEFHVPRGGRGSIQLPQACLDAIKNNTFAGIAFYTSDRSLRYALGMSWKYRPNLLLNYQR